MTRPGQHRGVANIQHSTHIPNPFTQMMKNPVAQLFSRHTAASVLAGSALLLSQAFNAAAEVVIKDGQKLAFMGDSITQGGWGNPGGYVRLVIAGLEANGVKVTPIPAGISGHKSDQMLARLNKDVLEKKPDFMTLSCGVNDVWHGARGIPLDKYKANITAIVDQCAAASVKVVILTATVIGEDLGNDNNKKLAPYNEFLRSLAREKKLPLADLYAMFEEVIKTKTKPGNAYTSDGVHMNAAGDQLMARGVLQALGLDNAQIKKAQDAWLDLPTAAGVRARYDLGKGKSFQANARLSLRQLEQLKAHAAKQGKSLDEILNAAYAADVKAVFKPAGEFESAEALFAAKKDREVQAQLEKKFAAHVEALLKK